MPVHQRAPSIVVQKFGGTSVADTRRILACAERAVAVKRAGHHVVVVVSAMGHTTDELIDLAGEISDRPPQREMDMLMASGEQVSIALMAMAIHTLGEQAVSFLGHQLGIITDPAHCKAKIASIDATRLRHELEAGRIPVIAGFQGVTPDGQITTLGRGGSDTTAVAIAAALKSSRPLQTSRDHKGADAGNVPPPPHGRGSLATDVVCEIYTDVDGVYTADPRRVPGARKISRISYEEMLELASLGAGVMHSRAVMFGRNYGVPIHVRLSRPPHNEGTMIVPETSDMEYQSVVGCALTPDLGRISLRKIPNRSGIQGEIFRHIADANVLVDDIMQIEYRDLADISFTVDFKDLADIKAAVQKSLDEIGTGEMAVEVGLAKVSAVGVGMRTHTGVAATMFRALGEAGITIANITTSEIKISCIIPRERGEEALRLVHDAFGLDRNGGSEVRPLAKAGAASTG
jgi:aspartate kinase